MATSLQAGVGSTTKHPGKDRWAEGWEATGLGGGTIQSRFSGLLWRREEWPAGGTVFPTR